MPFAPLTFSRESRPAAGHVKRRAAMRLRLCTVAFALLCCSLVAQAPALVTHDSQDGFSYTLPAGWKPIDGPRDAAPIPLDARKTAGKKDDIKSIACTQVAFSAHHGNPGSVIVVVTLPFACYGQVMTSKNLPGFAAGVSDGLKQHFQISDSVYGSYKLGSHNFWIERAVAVPKNHPGDHYTVETACSILKKSAVCWMTTAASAGGLRDFEKSLVVLDGESAVALVPANAFVKKPLLQQMGLTGGPMATK